MNTHYIATSWVLTTKKSGTRRGYAILELPSDFVDLTEYHPSVFDVIPAELLQIRIRNYKRRESAIPQHTRYRRLSQGEKIYIQRKDIKKAPFVKIVFPAFFRKKHIQTFFSLFDYKYWVRVFYPQGKEIIICNYENVSIINLDKIKNDESAKISITRI